MTAVSSSRSASVTREVRCRRPVPLHEPHGKECASDGVGMMDGGLLFADEPAASSSTRRRLALQSPSSTWGVVGGAVVGAAMEGSAGGDSKDGWEREGGRGRLVGRCCRLTGFDGAEFLLLLSGCVAMVCA